MTRTPIDITVEDLKNRIDRGDDVVILDVREPIEVMISNIGGVHIPLRQLPVRINELKPEQEIAVLCHHGNRSRSAAEFLRKSGFDKAFNVSGGIDAWSKRVDPKVPRY